MMLGGRGRKERKASSASGKEGRRRQKKGQNLLSELSQVWIYVQYVGIGIGSMGYDDKNIRKLRCQHMSIYEHMSMSIWINFPRTGKMAILCPLKKRKKVERLCGRT